MRYADIPGFPGYRVGEDGTVWSCRPINGRGPFTAWREMRQFSKKHGSGFRREVCLVKQKRRYFRRVARLVLESFIGPCPAGNQCCHTDDDPANNCLSNLRWDTPLANAVDKARNGKMYCGSRHWCAVLTEDIVRELRSKDQVDVTKTALMYGVSYSTVASALSGKTWKQVC